MTPSPVCTPARAALMTAEPGNVTGVERHGDFLAPGIRSVAHAFGAAGYRTSYVGKWHLAPESGAHMVSSEGWVGQEFWVHPRLRGGFQDWFGFNISNNYYRTFIASGEKVAPVELPGYQTDALTDLSIGYLGERVADDPGRPWFHVIAYESPHPGAGAAGGSASGYPVPEPFGSAFPPDQIRLRPNVPLGRADEARQQLAGYYRLIANLDANVGRLLDYLDDLGVSEDTLVVFTSDHGEMGGSHGLRNKQVPFDESLHVPLLFRHPGRLPAAAEYHGSVSLLDVAPTSLALASAGTALGSHGLDHSPLLLTGADGRTDPLRDSVLVQWNAPRFAFGDHPYRALRSERYTYVAGRDTAFCLLFDRYADPYELENLYGHPANDDLQRSLHERLLKSLAQAGETPPDFVLTPPRPSPS